MSQSETYHHYYDGASYERTEIEACRALTAEDIAYFVGAWNVLCRELDLPPVSANPYDIAQELRRLRAEVEQ